LPGPPGLPGFSGVDGIDVSHNSVILLTISPEQMKGLSFN